MRSNQWKLWTLAAAVALVVSCASALRFATAEAPADDQAAAPREPGREPRGPRGPREADEPPMTAKGKVERYATNPEGDVDGLVLADGVEVKLPPHQSDALQKLISKGDEVTAEGRRHETPEGDVHLHARRITVVATGKTIEADEPRDRRPPPRGNRGPGTDRGPDADRGPGRDRGPDADRGPGRGPDRGPGRGPEDGPGRGPGRGPDDRPERGPGADRDRPEPPFQEILHELREIRRLLEAQSRK